MSVAVFEHAFYIGSYLGGILYGMELIACYATMKALWRKPQRRKSDYFYMMYSTALLMLVTIDVSTNAVYVENMLITSSMRSGGAAAFIATHSAVWYQTLSSTSVVILIFMNDALMIYRCFIFWGSRIYIVVLPILIYLGAFSLAICELISSGISSGDFFAGKSVDFGVPYYAMSIALNIILTILICGRLLYLSRRIRNALGEQSARIYTSVIAILVESAAPYSLFGIMFVVPYARNAEVAIAFGEVWAKVAGLAPQLIVLRIVTQRAWTKTTIDSMGDTSRTMNPFTTAVTMDAMPDVEKGGSCQSISEPHPVEIPA